MSFTVGPLVLSLDRVVFILAFCTALLVGWWMGRRRQIQIEPALTHMLLFGFLGARLGFVVLYLDDYLAKPWSIIDIRDGGFLIVTGLAAAAITGGFYAWRTTQLRAPLAAAVSVGLMFWATGTAVSNFQYTAQREVPKMALPNLQGEFQSLRELRQGKPLVVNVWATWCPPCRREMPVLAEAQQRERDITMVLINQGETAEVVSAYLEKEQLDLNNMLLDPQSRTLLEMGVRALPATFFFDAEGQLVDSHFGELSTASLRHALRQLTVNNEQWLQAEP